MKEKKRKSIISIGIISLLTIFVILLLTSFSLLIFSGAGTDYELSQKAADATTAYYAADALAEEKLMEIHDLWLSSEGDDLKTALQNDDYTVSETENSGHLVYFELDVNDDKKLIVELYLPFDKEENIKRTKWQSSPR